MQVLLVDLYDTLVRPDWWGLAGRIRQALGVTGEQLMAAFEATREHRATGASGSVLGDLAAVAAACAVERDRQSLSALADDVVATLKTATHVFEDVAPTLTTLRARGTRIAMVSNCDHATAPMLTALGLDRLVDTVVLSCEVGWAKPDARIYLESLRRLGARPEQAAFVDDQPSFLDAAADLGIATYLIEREPAEGAAGAPPQPETRHRRIRSLAELLRPAPPA